MIFREALEALTSVLFPASCQSCDRALTNASLLPIYNGCLVSLAPFQGPCCATCGRPFVAELIARTLARKLKMPLGAHLLVGTKPRPPRLLLSRRERWQTVRGAYEIRKGTQVDNLRVLLIDDVFTTGATLDACARAWKRAGAKSVVGITVARVLSRGSAFSGRSTELTKNRTPVGSI